MVLKESQCHGKGKKMKFKFLNFNKTLIVASLVSMLFFSSHRAHANLRCIVGPAVTLIAASACKAYADSPAEQAVCVGGVSVLIGVQFPLLLGMDFLSMGLLVGQAGVLAAVGTFAKKDPSFKNRFWMPIWGLRGIFTGHALYSSVGSRLWNWMSASDGQKSKVIVEFTDHEKR